MRAIIVLLVLTSCSPKAMSIYAHDHQNPCKPNQPYYNPDECERWKKMEPRQYNRYLEREKRLEEFLKSPNVKTPKQEI